MLYNKWGDVLKIERNCGQVLPEGFVAEVTLVKVVYADKGGDADYAFAEFLRADDGINEIFQAVEQAPKWDMPEALRIQAVQKAL